MASMSSRAASARKPSTGRGIEFARRLLGSHAHLFAHRPHFKPIGQGPQRRPVSDFPGFSQTNKSDAQLHGGKTCLRSEFLGVKSGLAPGFQIHLDT